MITGKPHEFGEYTIDGDVIKVCDLGVQIDCKLKFHNHTTVVTKKANRLVACNYSENLSTL